MFATRAECQIKSCLSNPKTSIFWLFSDSGPSDPQFSTFVPNAQILGKRPIDPYLDVSIWSACRQSDKSPGLICCPNTEQIDPSFCRCPLQLFLAQKAYLWSYSQYQSFSLCNSTKTPLQGRHPKNPCHQMPNKRQFRSVKAWQLALLWPHFPPTGHKSCGMVSKRIYFYSNCSSLHSREHTNLAALFCPSFRVELAEMIHQQQIPNRTWLPLDH